MMKRHVVLMAIVLAFCFVSLGLAAPKEGKGGKKQTVVGTITQVNPKAKTITVKPAESGEQVQTQQELPKQEKNPDKPKQFVFQVDENTVIEASGKGKQQQGQEQGQEQGQPSKGGFKLLQPGQTVQVVYEVEEAKPTQEQQGQQQAQGEQEGQQDQGQVDKKKDGGKKAGGKRVLRALSIKVLKQPTQQQEEK